MKIGAYTIVYSEIEWLKACAPQLAVFDNVVVVCSTKPTYWQGLDGKPSLPSYEAEVQALCDRWGFKCLIGDFSANERGGQDAIGRQRQAGADWLRNEGCEAMAWFSVDELYTVEDARKLREALRSDPRCVFFAEHLFTLWHNEHWQTCYAPPLSGLPIYANCYSHEIGGPLVPPETRETYVPGTTCWHFAFAKSPQDMYQKWFGWGLASSNSKSHWDSWNNWTPKTNVNSPLNWPSCHAEAVGTPLPEDLRQRLAHILPLMKRHPEDGTDNIVPCSHRDADGVVCDIHFGRKP